MANALEDEVHSDQDLHHASPSEVEARVGQIREILADSEIGYVLTSDLFSEDYESCVTRAAVWHMTSGGEAKLRPRFVENDQGEPSAEFALSYAR